MAFLGKAVKGVGKFLLGGGLLGGVLGGILGKKKQSPLGLPRPATRDDAAVIAERDAELARRRGASADRIAGASGEPVGGFGNMIRGS